MSWVSPTAVLLASEQFPNRLEALIGLAVVAMIVGGFLLVYSWSTDPLPGRRRISRRLRRARRHSAPSWAAGEHIPEPAATVPLPWQTVKPTVETAERVRPPVDPASSPSPPPRSADAPAARPSAPAGPTSSPVSAGPMSPPPGWYPNPADPSRARWWDGAAWTDEVR